MRAPHGYAIWVSPDAPPVERDTCTCGHCGAIIFTKPGTASTVYLLPHPTDPTLPDSEEPGAFCRLCMTPVCLRCHADGRCLPLERQLEASESRDRLRRAVLGG